MELFPCLCHIVVCCLYLFVVKELVVAACHVYLHEVLIYDPAGSEVEVADFRVSHLAVRKSDIFSACLEMSGRVFCPE